MAKTIPPSGKSKRAKWERRADALLEAAGEEAAEGWPGFWPKQAETEFERIVAAHTGMVPLGWTAIVAMLPSCDPELRHRDVQSVMEQRPGECEPDRYGELLSLLSEAERDGVHHGTGFIVERRNYPLDSCRWTECREPLYALQGARKRGRPRRYCEAHQKPARARTRRLRYAGIQVGRNRNLVYDFGGLKEQDLSGYRELWGRVNVAGS